MPFSITCNHVVGKKDGSLRRRSDVLPRFSSASVHHFRSWALFSSFLPLHAYTETSDLLCPLFLFFCLKLWVINLPSQHLQELLGRRRKLRWTQFLPTAQYRILSPAQLTRSLLTHSNPRKHNGDGCFSCEGTLHTNSTYFNGGNNLQCTNKWLFFWRTKWLFCILLCTFIFCAPESSLPLCFWRLWLLLLPGNLSVDMQISKETHSEIIILEISLNCTENELICSSFQKKHRLSPALTCFFHQLTSNAQ